MDSLFLVCFTLAVHLASRAGAQTTPPSSITTVVTIPATTAIITATDGATDTTTTSDLTNGTDYPPITTTITPPPTSAPSPNTPSTVTPPPTSAPSPNTPSTVTPPPTSAPSPITPSPTSAPSPNTPSTITPSTITPSTITPSTVTPSPTSAPSPNTPSTITPSPTSTPSPITTNTTSTPSPITTNTTSAPSPLVCGNGGLSLNGVCICPDEWTGETCSVENFCRFQKLDNFNFPRTPIGWFAYSEESCPKGTRSAGKAEASSRCSNNNGLPSFQGLYVLQCDQTLSDLLLNLTSPADFENLASSTQILTSKPEELTAEDITAAAQIANTLLLSPTASESVRVAGVSTVSQLLIAGPTDNSEENNATLSLTVTLDQLSVNLGLGLKASQSQVVQPNLVVQSARVSAADSQGVQFTSLAGTSGSFVANRIQLNTNTPTVVLDNEFIADAVIYVRFPPGEVREKTSEVSLGFVLYQNDRFFRSRRFSRSRTTFRVLSASVKGPRSGVAPQHVELLFRPTVMNGTSLFNFACVFWNYSVMDWSTDGCWKGNASDGLLRCSCNHTTNFAALWSFRENYEYAEALDAISLVGLSFSILGLIVTIIHQLKQSFQINCCKKNNKFEVKNSEIALLCICVSLLAFIITFISGVGNSSRRDAPADVDAPDNSLLDGDEHVDPDSGSCSAVVALLHFFLLATFVWNGLYATVMMLLDMGKSLPTYWTPISLAVGWGGPAVVMFITLGATYRPDDPLGYRQEEFCWLAALDKNKQFHFGKPMFWGFLLPVGLILIYVTALLVLNIRSCSIKCLSLWNKFLTSYSLAMLLGLSWALGYLVLVTTGTTHLVFSIVFCLCSTTQGLQIFVLFTARKPDFRASVTRSIKYVSSIELKHSKYRVQREWTSTRGPNVSNESNSDPKVFNECYRDLKDFNESYGDPKDFNECYRDLKDFNESYGDPKDFNESYGDLKDFNESYGDPKDFNESYGYLKDFNETYGDPKDFNESYGYLKDFNETYGDPKDFNESYGYLKDFNETYGDPKDFNESFDTRL